MKILDDISTEDAIVGFIYTKVMPKKSNNYVEEREKWKNYNLIKEF